MTASILAIIAALLPLLIDYLEGRREEKPYDDLQEIRKETAAGDIDALAARIDRLREKAARLRDG